MNRTDVVDLARERERRRPPEAESERARLGVQVRHRACFASAEALRTALAILEADGAGSAS